MLKIINPIYDYQANLATGYTREAFASFPQVSEEDTPGTSRTVYPQFF